MPTINLTVAPENREDKGWIGERFDPETGLQYLNARYYDPELGMFLQPDWWEVTQAGVGTNRYGYSAGDPVNRVDANGNLWNDAAFSRGYDSVFGAGSWDNTAIGRADTGGQALGNSVDSVGYGYDSGVNELKSNVGPYAGAAVGFFAPSYKDTRAGVVASANAISDGDLGGAATGLGTAALGLLGGKGRVAKEGAEKLLNVKKTYFRSMSKAELQAVKETGQLRGGRPGETYFTNQRMRSVNTTMDRLSLQVKPDVQVEFRVTNNPIMEKNGTRVERNFGRPGGGREYMATDTVEVEIINVQPY